MKLALFTIIIQGARSFQAPQVTLAGRLSLPSPLSGAILGSSKLTSLKMVDDPNEVEDSEEEEAFKSQVASEKIEGRKRRVTMTYKISFAQYSIIGAIMFSLTRNPFYSSGPLLAAGINYIMIGASQSDRLSSDTYKRLNISLWEYGIVGLAAGAFMKLSWFWMLASTIVVVNSTKGYGYGLKGWELGNACAKEELINGMKSNLESVTKIPNLKSAGYLAATLTIGSLKVAKIAEIFRIIKSGEGSYMFGTRLFRLARLILMAIVTFTLKDAADRGRLEGTTFIELNFMASFSFASWAAYESISTALGRGFGLFSLVCAFNGMSSYMKKNN